LDKPSSEKKHIRILGTRGIPARHGGFETFAEHFAQYLQNQGWKVTVYCQIIGKGTISEVTWNGIHCINIPVSSDSSFNTMIFDLKSSIHAALRQGICLTLGYNTAIFTCLLRLCGHKTIMNMDGIEWSRAKWSLPVRYWLRINEWVGAKLNHRLIADHPEISKHLQRLAPPERIVMIPYGASSPNAPDSAQLNRYDLKPYGYAIIIARPEPENSILEMVRAWSKKQRGIKLVVVGKYCNQNPYQKQVMNSASSDVIFLGAIYEKETIESLRYFASFYMHGHQVGGTNPSLVEALACKNPILAHDNRFNRWVAGQAGLYFSNEDECLQRIEEILSINLQAMRDAAEKRHRDDFSFDHIHCLYEKAISS